MVPVTSNQPLEVTQLCSYKDTISGRAALVGVITWLSFSSLLFILQELVGLCRSKYSELNGDKMGTKSGTSIYHFPIFLNLLSWLPAAFHCFDGSYPVSQGTRVGVVLSTKYFLSNDTCGTGEMTTREVHMLSGPTVCQVWVKLHLLSDSCIHIL